ncbi:hypothetical protein EYF80_041523 [Liparis tanakae]|uniref:Secreted protein n=1 Tax=Liparis tanakae TaxID=230148 RepID=A0A4Z2G5V9_9TELE|nr:hypothetical protein EYF80_041523 [Liparis tanakae]
MNWLFLGTVRLLVILLSLEGTNDTSTRRPPGTSACQGIFLARFILSLDLAFALLARSELHPLESSSWPMLGSSSSSSSPSLWDEPMLAPPTPPPPRGRADPGGVWMSQYAVLRTLNEVPLAPVSRTGSIFM